MLSLRITDGNARASWHAGGMPGRSFRIARIAGIPIGISPLWLLIVALFTWVLGDSYYPTEVKGIGPLAAYGLGLLSVLLLFASVLAHELGHAIVARQRGIEVEEIDLWLLGGVSRLRGHPRGPGDELRYAAAGPGVTAVIAALFIVLALLLPRSTPSAVSAVVMYQVYMNVVLLGFNLVPAFPMDGGRIARALMWRRSGDLAGATRVAATLGRVFGWLMVGLGVLAWLDGAVGGVVLAMIGGFVVVAGRAEQAQEQVLAALSGVTVRELMSTPATTIPACSTVAEAQNALQRCAHSCFPLVDEAGAVVGLLTIDGLERAVDAELERPVGSDRFTVLAVDFAERDSALLVDLNADVAVLLERPAFGRVGRAVVIDTARRPAGVVTQADIQRAIRVSRQDRHVPPSARLERRA
ncbi:MAG: M50 family metallopeptidase [Solirubrobacteraceae bacterium]